jgi:hypothetical protein
MPTVNRVRKERSPSGTHEHIADVCTTDNYRYTRAQVIAGIDAGQQWQTYGGGRSARIEKIRFCPAAGCYESPYIRTVADSYAPDNLDNLPAC